MSQTINTTAEVGSADQLSAPAREALRVLILRLADSKRLLGIRYSDWMLGAPSLETGIAASSMAQDEWGHSRLTYALLSDFGDDPKQLEHDRPATEYFSMAPFDAPFQSWSELLAAALLLDTALTTQYSALATSSYLPVRKRMQKLLDEEEYHFQYAAGWAPRLRDLEIPREEFAVAAGRFLPYALQWLASGATEAEALQGAEVTRFGPSELQSHYLARVAPILDTLELARRLAVSDENGGWRYTGLADVSGWNEARRRVGDGGPDEETIARVRGDRNRAMRLD